ncbi:DUF3597 domain-containing protein [Erythrobacter sp. SDW2]|uniref:DUF3597 domain-containing protein n=1 Tax=Erythrobacter sp. SDW2 TaxID=2907154 RepID=UPI001F2527BF|nr:DUF3597 domain-containing protein [Erythrobacter sp. SDW2]UIP06412.1 DUF3597 domain-containing protein [Erythrobacter sp. SDW2]
MGIFSSIRNAIFGEKDRKPEVKAEPAPSPVTAVPERPAAPAAISEVDVEARLAAMEGADQLNWRSSIVDLFKLIGLDPSYANRQELAEELGRTDYEGSAEDNIWLHRATMQELARNGGKVPAEMMN